MRNYTTRKHRLIKLLRGDLSGDKYDGWKGAAINFLLTYYTEREVEEFKSLVGRSRREMAVSRDYINALKKPPYVSGEDWSMNTMAIPARAKQVWANYFGSLVPKGKDAFGKEIALAAYRDENSNYGWDIDHIKPKSEGGSNDPSNLRPLNMRDNRRKGDS